MVNVVNNEYVLLCCMALMVSPHGAELRVAKKAMRCGVGDWQNAFYLFPVIFLYIF